MTTKMTKLVNEYKAIAKEVRKIAKRYRQLHNSIYVYNIRTSKVVNEYRDLWRKMIWLNDRAYGVMLAIRHLAETPLFRILYAVGITNVHGFRYTDKKNGWIKYDQLINIAWIHTSNDDY